MANVASIFKAEIARVARKELRRETAALKKASAIYRSEIAALKRRLEVLERNLHKASKAGTANATVAANDRSIAEGTRFSAKSVASQRRRLGLSAADVGLLVGATAQSVYNWEEGKARPRAQHLPAIFALRNLGRRAAMRSSRRARLPSGFGAPEPFTESVLRFASHEKISRSPRSDSNCHCRRAIARMRHGAAGNAWSQRDCS